MNPSHRPIVRRDEPARSAGASLEVAKARLRALADPDRSSNGLVSPIASIAKHPLGWAAGALVLGFGLTTVARTAAGRSVLKLAGRSAMTAARLLVVPMVAKAVATTVSGNDDDHG